MFRMTVEDVFVIRNRGVVATGRVESGTLRVGDTVQIDGTLDARIDGIEVFRRSIDEAKAGDDNIGVLFRGIEKSQLDRGSVLTAAGEFPPIEQTGSVI
jgi:translation elongation factor EF-Tu-like GTPase